MRNIIFLPAQALVACLLITSCSSTELKPASSAQQVDDMDNAARANVADVEVLVQDAPWPGDAPVEQQVTPLRVSITNNGEEPLRIAYDRFTLVAPDGVVSSALPLYEIDGTVDEPVVVNAAPIASNPGFVHTNFAVAPYLSSVYPSVRSSALPFHYNEYYYGSQLTHWQTTSMPTPEMRMNALPEGVLESGGQVDGWLYFGEIEDAERVTFRADLTSADSGGGIGEARIPFEVQ